jgi:hypothetical protein
MGIFDYLRLEMPMPDGQEVVPGSFQTKSLWCTMDRFTITSSGRLVFHRPRPGPTPVAEGEPALGRLAPVGDIDLDYHGDLATHGTRADWNFVSYAVRFSHGTVEWIRALDALPAIHQIWLLEKGQ